MSDFKRYVSTTEVEARQLTEDETVVTAHGSEPANEGDYVVRDDSGAVRVVPREVFEDSFKAAAGGRTGASKSS